MTTQGPWFIVIGYDDPGFPADLATEDDLNEAHWSYIEQAGPLLARGPLLTADGRHAGSVHIVAATDLSAAQRFAFDEPYHLAGVFERVEVSRFSSWLTHSMWERPREPGAPSWLVLLRVNADGPVPLPPTAGPVTNAVVCGGWLTDPDDQTLRGAAVFCDGTRDGAEALAAALDELIPTATTTSITQWRRGGRPSTH